MNAPWSKIAGVSAELASRICSSPQRLVILLLAVFAWTANAVADPPIVNKPSGASVKSYGKPKPGSKPGISTQGNNNVINNNNIKRPPHVVIVPRPTPPVFIDPKPKQPKLSGIATPFPDSNVTSYPTKVEVRPAQPPVGPAYPLTRFSQFGRPNISPFAVNPSGRPTVQQFVRPLNASGIAATNTPVLSGISTTKTVSSFTPVPKTVVPTHPSGYVVRSGHPVRPEKWQKVQDRCNDDWNYWHKKNVSYLGDIKGNRMRNWGEVAGRYREPGWAKHFHGQEYKRWCGEVWNYRRDRCVEVWSDRKPFWNHVFDQDWWSACWWRKDPPKHVRGAHESPWWWWRGCEPEQRRTFFGVALAVPAVIYDPGASVLYDGSNYYVDGGLVSTAVDARQQAIDLANPDVSGIALPEPAPEGEAETWLPLGVWALAQQQQGDPTMFVQLSVNKDGIVAGAYKNILTGDEQPIVGKVDLKTQRIAWHVGDASQTVYETGLTGLDNDVASVFIHFGTEATQTWLLVKLPSPEMPPGPVKTPKVD